MKDWWKWKIIYLGLMVFALIVLITIYLIIKLGGAYRGGISLYSSNQATSQTLILKKKKDIKRITIRKQGEVGCMEVTPDGIVRQYSVCGSDLTDVQRLNDSKNIVQLFKLVSENELIGQRNTGGQLYELTIQTDTGTQVVYYSVNGASGASTEIVQTIQLIQGDLSSPSPSSSSALLPTSTPHAAASSSPGDTIVIYPSPTPAVSVTSQLPFTCDFIESGVKKKPFNVSNIICSTEHVSLPH